MTEPARGFPEDEYRARLGRAQRRMTRAGLSALLLTTPHDILYMTGFLTRFWESPTRPWFVVVPAAGDPVAVIPSIGSALMARTWVRDIRCWQSPDPVDDGIGLLTDTLRGLAGKDGQVGVPMGPETHLRMPLADWKKLRDTSDLTFVSDDGMLRDLRANKSEREIDKIRHACQIANRAFTRVPEIAAAGVPLDAVFRRFQILCLEEGADWVPYLAGGAGQGGYADVISPAGSEPLLPGDILMLDTGLVCDGYFCDFDRNFSVGPPSSEVREAHARLIDATDAAAALAVPGRTAADLFHAMDRILTGGAGGSDAGRFGHGLGLQLTEGLSIIPTDRTELTPGMVITLEPGIELSSGRIMVHEENLAVREEAPEFLSARAGRDIVVLEG